MVTQPQGRRWVHPAVSWPQPVRTCVNYIREIMMNRRQSRQTRPYNISGRWEEELVYRMLCNKLLNFSWPFCHNIKVSLKVSLCDNYQVCPRHRIQQLSLTSYWVNPFSNYKNANYPGWNSKEMQTIREISPAPLHRISVISAQGQTITAPGQIRKSFYFYSCECIWTP